MDGDNNIHRLRVLSFGNNARTDYFVEQLGDHADHVKLGPRTQRSRNDAELCRLEFHKSAKKDQSSTSHVKPSQREPNDTRKTRQEFRTSTFRDQGDYSQRKNKVQSEKIQKSIKDQVPDRSISIKEQKNTEVNKPRLTSEEKDNIPIKRRKESKSGEITAVRSEKRKSNSGIFRIPSKRKVKTKHTRHKIFIFDDVKRSFSHHSFKCSDRIKDALFNRNKSLKLKVNKKKRGKELKDLGEKKDNVQILFLREKDIQENKSTTSKKRREDIFGFQTCNRFSRPSISVYQQYRSQLFRPKKNKSVVMNPRISHSTDSHVPLRLLAAKSADSCIGSQFNTVHAVNVVEFPRDTNAFQSKSYTKSLKSPQIIAPAIVSHSKCLNDAGVETAQLSYKNVALSPEPSLPLCDPCTDICDPCTEICDPCTETFHAADVEEYSTTTAILKYILFGLVILVWSPCIIMVIICWLITYPLRPSCIRARARARYGLDQEKLPCGVSITQSSFWTSFVNWIKSAEWFNRGAYKAVASLIKVPQKNKAEMVCEHQLLPNVNKRYTLYHSTERGWVMKPVKISGGRQRKTEILNVACDPLCSQNEKSSGKILKEIARDKKKVRIAATLPSKSRQDYGTVTPKTVKYRKYKTKNPGKDKVKVIASQKDVPYQSRVLRYQQGEEHLKKCEKNWLSLLLCGPKGKARNEMPCLPCRNRSAPLARPPCVPCRMNLHKQLKEIDIHGISKNIAQGKGRQNKSEQRKVKQSNLMQDKINHNKLIQDKTKHSKLMQDKTKHSKVMQDKIKHSKLMQDKLRQRKLMQNKLMYDETKRNVGRLKYERFPKTKIYPVRSRNVCIRAFHNFKDSIDEMETAVWYPEFECNHLWIHTLRRKPCFWIYKMCSSCYGTFLGVRRICGNCCQLMLLCLSTVIWFPPIFCCYLCLEVFCRICS